MTGTTHQLIALVTAFFVLTLYPIHLGPVVGLLAIVAVMVGALTPDLDQPTANIWRRLLGGRAIGNIFQVFSGGHRHLTHAVLGIVGIGVLLRFFINHGLHPDIVPAAEKVWYAFMIGYISHPIADTLTDRGVPWFWPLRIHIRIPPGPEEVRVTTDSLVERLLVRGGFILILALLLVRKWPLLVEVFRP